MAVHALEVRFYERLGHVGGILTRESGVQEDSAADFLESIGLN